MKTQALMMAALSMCALLAGCDADTHMMDGALLLKGDRVILAPKGQPEAQIDANGGFYVQGQRLDTPPAAQTLLMAYYQDVASVRDTGLAMGKLGGKMAVSALTTSDHDKRDAQTQAQGDQMQQLSLKICAAQADIKKLQDQLAAQWAAFKPYGAVVDQASVDGCGKDDDNDKDGKAPHPKG